MIQRLELHRIFNQMIRIIDIIARVLSFASNGMVILKSSSSGPEKVNPLSQGNGPMQHMLYWASTNLKFW